MTPRRGRRRRRNAQGIVAVMTAAMFLLLFGMAAFAVDVGRWYLAGRETQRAADAAALAGVPFLPSDQTGAFATARNHATRNGFTQGTGGAIVTPEIESTPTRLKVTVSTPVTSVFGGLLGISRTTITRSAVADYAGPVPLGSPCNEYGNDPDSGGIRSGNCSDTGQFWGNVGSPLAPKNNGDAFQDGCSNTIPALFAGTDGCAGGTNSDYDTDGYFYAVTLTKPVQNLRIQAYDPALISVGDFCDSRQGDNANVLQTDSNGVPKTPQPPLAKDLSSSNTVPSDPSTRYSGGPSSPYCTGDIAYGHKMEGFDHQVATRFTIRNPGPDSWDPLSFPVNPSCTGAGVYPGYAGDLEKALDKSDSDYKKRPADTPGIVSAAKNDGYVASVFRRWKTLCSIPSAPAGTYLIQINTQGLGFDDASGHNRFALRAYSTTDSSAKDSIAVSGFQKMAMYANLPNATSTFYLARVPSGAAGQILHINLFDVGDSSQPGTIQVVAPSKSGVTFTSCTASGAFTGALSNCQLTGVSTSSYNGKWEQISVQIPTGYTCKDLDLTDCWVKLKYVYGSGNLPSDTTSWTASIEGDPVRLVE